MLAYKIFRQLVLGISAVVLISSTPLLAKNDRSDSRDSAGGGRAEARQAAPQKETPKAQPAQVAQQRSPSQAAPAARDAMPVNRNSGAQVSRTVQAAPRNDAVADRSVSSRPRGPATVVRPSPANRAQDNRAITASPQPRSSASISRTSPVNRQVVVAPSIAQTNSQSKIDRTSREKAVVTARPQQQTNTGSVTRQISPDNRSTKPVTVYNRSARQLTSDNKLALDTKKSSPALLDRKDRNSTNIRSTDHRRRIIDNPARGERKEYSYASRVPAVQRQPVTGTTPLSQTSSVISGSSFAGSRDSRSDRVGHDAGFDRNDRRFDRDNHHAGMWSRDGHFRRFDSGFRPHSFRRVEHFPRTTFFVNFHFGRHFTPVYVNPYFHRRFIFVSINGYWPVNCFYPRYYTYGYYPYYWYGYDPVLYEAQGDTYNYYTYNYYGENNYAADNTSVAQPSTYGTGAVDENTYADVREKLAMEAAQKPATETQADKDFDKGVDKFGKGDYASAAEQFKSAMSIDPTDVVLPFAYTQAVFATGNYIEAAEALRNAIGNMKPDERGLFYPRGLYLKDEVLFAQIDKLAQQAGVYNSDSDLQLLLGYQLLGVGKFDEARMPLEFAKNDLRNGKTAAILLDMLDKAKAEAAVNQAISTAPKGTSVQSTNPAVPSQNDVIQVNK